MATGLHLHAVAGIDEQHGDIGRRRTGSHVARVLLMAGGIGNDVFAAVGGEEAVSHIDGDALFALGLQAVYQQRQIHDFAGGAVLDAVTRDGGELVFEDHLRVVQQAADQRRLAVIHAAAGDEAQHVLVFMLVQVVLNIVDTFNDH